MYQHHPINQKHLARTIAESLSMNTPVIASNHGGAKDIIIDQKNGLLFEPKNKNELTKTNK